MLGSIAHKDEGSLDPLLRSSGTRVGENPSLLPTHLGSPFILHMIGFLFSGTSEFHPLGWGVGLSH